MRHDEERPRTSGFLTDGTVPGHWTQVLGSMRVNPFTYLSPDEVRTEAAHLLIVAPSPEVARACFAELLGEFGVRSSADGSRHTSDSSTASDLGRGPGITITAPEDLVASDVPAGTWVFLPHRQDGWTELEDASVKLRATLVKENSTREAGGKLVLMEYGINLWMWAEPPSSGGDPVCHAGELISWESAWALGPAQGRQQSGAPAGEGASASDGVSAGDGTTASDCVSAGEGTTASGGASADEGASADSPAAATAAPPAASARPPIYFGLPPILRKQRWDS